MYKSCIGRCSAWVLFASIFFGGLASCKEEIYEHGECSQGIIIGDQYINEGLGFSIEVPHSWDTIPTVELDKYRDKGFEILGDPKSYNYETRLLSLQNLHDGHNSTLEISCISRQKYHRYRTSGEFAQFNKEILDTGFSKTGLLSTFTLDSKNLGNKEFARLKVELSKNIMSKKTYEMELLYLFYKESVLTVTIGYNNHAECTVLYKVLETLNFQPEV